MEQMLLGQYVLIEKISQDKAKLKNKKCRMRSWNIMKWKDKPYFHISTKHETVEMTKQNRSQLNPIFKLTCIDYNR